MNIKILDSWLRDYLKTKATPEKIGELLSLSSVSVERIEKYKNNDYTYDIEITTNRPDLMSVIGIAREAATVLNQNGIEASFLQPKFTKPLTPKTNLIEIKNNPNLVNRLLAVVMEVEIDDSPKEITERLGASGTRSLNNLIDITNYVSKTTGHPTHVFDFDRLQTKVLTIREAKSQEQIQTLDKKIYSLSGGEIVAANKNNEIVDLMGIMGLENSVVTQETKRILYFINNNEPTRIRKTSMSLGIRTEAAVLNEKNLDPLLAFDALLYGVELYKKIAKGKIISDIIDIYPNKPKDVTIEVTLEKINKVIGVSIDPKKALKSLTDLGFKAEIKNGKIKVNVPSFRVGDVTIEEDVIEEIARIYGYHNLPSVLPAQTQINPHKFTNEFYWETKLKHAMKYWGFTETYTYSMVSEGLFEGSLDLAVEIKNPLNEDFVYMRNSIVPSLLKIVSENSMFEKIQIFEISNIYRKRENDLPQEILTFAGIIKKEHASFYEVKGLIESALGDLGINKVFFKSSEKTDLGTSVFIDKDYIGEIEILDSNLIDFELNFAIILKHVSSRKVFTPFAKYPPIIEDLTIIVDKNLNTEDLVNDIRKQSSLITEVNLKDIYEDARTFHIVFQDLEKNLTKEDVSLVREKIVNSLKLNFEATIK